VVDIISDVFLSLDDIENSVLVIICLIEKIEYFKVRYMCVNIKFNIVD